MTTWPLLLVYVAAPLVASAIERARQRAALSHKDLALAQGLTQAHWSQQLSGYPSSHIWLDRLTATPEPFRAALLEELALVWGVPTLVTPAQVLDLIRREVHHA